MRCIYQHVVMYMNCERGFRFKLISHVWNYRKCLIFQLKVQDHVWDPHFPTWTPWTKSNFFCDSREFPKVEVPPTFMWCIIGTSHVMACFVEVFEVCSWALEQAISLGLTPNSTHEELRIDLIAAHYRCVHSWCTLSLHTLGALFTWNLGMPPWSTM